MYEGMAGVGKTATLCRLAQPDMGTPAGTAIYLALQPGEGVGSLLARVCARAKVSVPQGVDLQGDLYARLVDLLDKQQLVLLLDDLHHLSRTDLLGLVHSICRAKEGRFRVLAATQTDPNLSAMERQLLYAERLGPLPGRDVKAWVESVVDPSTLHTWAPLLHEATRGGALGQPLVCRFALGARAPAVVVAAMSGQSARSVHALRHLLGALPDTWEPPLQQALRALCRVGVPFAASVAEQALGPAIKELQARNLIDVLDGDVHVHALVQQYLVPLAPHVPVDAHAVLSRQSATLIANHLHDRARNLCESWASLRAAELLVQAGQDAEAVEILSESWQTAHDPGFIASYLRCVSGLQVSPPMQPRVRLLLLQARLQQGNVQNALAEVDTLAQSDDQWARQRALACAVQLHAARHDDAKVIVSFTALQEQKPPPEMLWRAGMAAVEAMVHASRPKEAASLALKLLERVHESPAGEAPLRMRLSQIEAQRGRLADAVEQAQRAGACYAQNGDWYHAAQAHHFVGDLHRAAGDFNAAKEAFALFLESAQKSGDRDLTQIAELAGAWVALDIGDVVAAARGIASVQANLGQAPSRRLLRYLTAAQALLDAGRGQHAKAASQLEKVVESWRAAREQSLTGKLQAQLVRSLIACDRLDTALEQIEHALQHLNYEQHTPHIAALLRERALIHLRRGEGTEAMALFDKARGLFNESGARREEALTLHRIAHAALDIGDLEMARKTVDEAEALARTIDHAHVLALTQELKARLALLADDPQAAVPYAKEALKSLRRLGDDVGLLHVSETLLRAYVAAGDAASALRIGPKVRAHAQRLEVLEVRFRASALCGVALLRRDRPEVAAKCYRDLDSRDASPWTRALMARFGEALSWAENNPGEALKRRTLWLGALRETPASRRPFHVAALRQLAMPPCDRCELRSPAGPLFLGTEEMGLLEMADYEIFVDVLHRRVYDGGTAVTMPSPGWAKLVMRCALAYPEPVSTALALQTLGHEGTEKSGIKKAQKEIATMQKKAPHLDLEWNTQGLRLVTGSTYAFLLPVWLTSDLTDPQKTIVKLLRKLGAAPANLIAEETKLSQASVKRELTALSTNHLVEAVREGRGQLYRLA